MKKKCSALLAVILAIAMLVTTMPSMVFAADTNATEQVGSHRMVDPATGAPAAGGSTTANTSADGLVTVDKTIEQIAENMFRITLNVTTKTKFESVTTSEDAAVVLMIDTSGSMEGRRLKEAQKAAQAFINSFASDTAVRKVAIVEFGSKVKGTPAWKDAKDLKTANADTLCQDLKNLQADGGTNMDAAFRSAKTQLDALKADFNIKNLNVVLLTDGEPTFYGLSGTQSYGDCSSHKTHEETQKSAKALGDAGYNMYAVYVGNEELVCYRPGLLGTEPNPNCYLNRTEDHWFWGTRVVGGTKVDKWLQNYCGFTTFAVSNLADLTKTFQDIAAQIELSAKAGVVTDPMGALIHFDDKVTTDDLDANDLSWSFAGNTLTWDLKKAKAVEIDNVSTYTLSYEITLNTLDQNFAAGTYYPTNGTTSMTYTVTENDKPTLGNIYFNIPTVKGFAGSYEFTKRDKATNNPLGGVEFTLTTPDDSDWSKVVYSDANGKVTIDNLPSGHHYVLRETTPLPGYQADTIDYALSVAHGVASSRNLAGKNNTILNESATYTLSVEKFWDDNGNNDGKRPDSVTVGLYEVDESGNAAGEPVQTITIQDDGQGNWVGQFENVPMARDGQLIDYTVKEITVPTGYTATVNEVRKDDQLSGFEITNTHTDEQAVLTITKKWKDNDDAAQKRPESVSVAINANGDKVGMVTLNADNDWTATVELPKYRDGQPITYTVLEEEVPEGYTDSYDQLTLTVTNTYGEGAQTTLNLVKVWADNNNNDGKRPDAIDVEILANGHTVKTVTLRADDGWKADITLPKYENGVELIYTVREKDVPAGYTVSYDGMTITNTSDGNEQTTLAITKTWKDDNNKAGKRPDSIEVEILADGQAVKTVTLAAKDGWKIEVQLDKYLNGKAITYTVQEKGVPEGYTAEYDQATLTITNTYKSTPTPTPTPATGGTGTAMLWMTLMLAAAAMLIGSVLLRKKLNA